MGRGIDWRFNTGKLSAPKIQSYGDALEPATKRIDRMADLERRQKEIEDKRAFQVSREEWKSQRDAEAVDTERAYNYGLKMKEYDYTNATNNANAEIKSLESANKNAKYLYGAEVDAQGVTRSNLESDRKYKLEVKNDNRDYLLKKDELKIRKDTAAFKRRESREKNRKDSYSGGSLNDLNVYDSVSGVQEVLGTDPEATAKLYKDKYKNKIDSANSKVSKVDAGALSKYESVIAEFGKDSKEANEVKNEYIQSVREGGATFVGDDTYAEKPIDDGSTGTDFTIPNYRKSSKGPGKGTKANNFKIGKSLDEALTGRKDIKILTNEFKSKTVNKITKKEYKKNVLNVEKTIGKLAERIKSERIAGNGGTNYVKSLMDTYRNLTASGLRMKTAQAEAEKESSKRLLKKDGRKEDIALKLTKDKIDVSDYQKKLSQL